jgi:ABC-type phosphate transport system auxiliary subunit
VTVPEFIKDFGAFFLGVAVAIGGVFSALIFLHRNQAEMRSQIKNCLDDRAEQRERMNRMELTIQRQHEAIDTHIQTMRHELNATLSVGQRDVRDQIKGVSDQVAQIRTHCFSRAGNCGVARAKNRDD